MIARPIGSCRGVDLVQTGDDLNLIPERCEGLHCRGELELFSLALWPPLVEIYAVRNRNERHPQGSSRRRAGRIRPDNFRSPNPARQKRRQSRQSYAGSNATQEPAPTKISFHSLPHCSRHRGTRSPGRCAVTFVAECFTSCYTSYGPRSEPATFATAFTRRCFWNGADSTTPINSAENLPCPRSSFATIKSTVCSS